MALCAGLAPLAQWTRPLLTPDLVPRADETCDGVATRAHARFCRAISTVVSHAALQPALLGVCVMKTVC